MSIQPRMVFRTTRTMLSAVLLAASAAAPLEAQVDLEPATVKPAAWERFALRVVNQTDTAFTRVRLTVPEVIMVLGVEPVSQWTFQLTASTDTTPQFIEWVGGNLLRGEYREFAFFGRIPGDARRSQLVFPVVLTRASGSLVEWNRRRDTGAPPTIQIVGTTSVTAWGSVALASVAVGIAVIALALAATARKRET